MRIGQMGLKTLAIRQVSEIYKRNTWILLTVTFIRGQETSFIHFHGMHPELVVSAHYAKKVITKDLNTNTFHFPTL